MNGGVWCRRFREADLCCVDRSRSPPLKILAVAATAVVCLAANAQVSPTTPPDDDQPLLLPEPSRPPLLREGSFLADAAGRLETDEKTGWWVFELDRDNRANQPKYGPHRLYLVPNRRLEEMLQIERSAPARDTLFQVTGQILVYRSENLLLLTQAPVVVEYQDIRPAAPPPPDPAPAPADESGDGDSIEDIMRELAEAVGPLQRPMPTPSPDTDLGPAPPRREGAMILARRGRLHRNSRGTWMFVFDADAGALADPPLIVMPCRMLERMEEYARQAGQDAPLLLSGRLFTFRGRNFVLPTVYRVPNHFTKITP